MTIKLLSGRLSQPIRMLVYGPPGAGKTTFASSAPGAVVLSGESGDAEIEERSTIVFEDGVVPRTQPRDWTEYLSKLKEIDAQGLPSGSTLVIDGFGRIERLAIEHVIANEKDDKDRKLKSLHGSWGAGDDVLIQIMREALSLVERIWYKGTHIVFVAHSKVETVKEPERDDYQRQCPDLNTASRGNVSAMLIGWCNVVAYLECEMTATGIKKRGGDDVKIFKPSGRRILHLDQSMHAFVAKCRGYDGEKAIALPKRGGFTEFLAHYRSDQMGREELVDQAAALLRTKKSGDELTTALTALDNLSNVSIYKLINK